MTPPEALGADSLNRQGFVARKQFEMTIVALYQSLKERFGSKSDPDSWWPIYYGRTDPPQFERVITNILVQNSSWKPVRAVVDSLAKQNLLSAQALASAHPEVIADCIRPTGLQRQKTGRLKTICEFVINRYGSEGCFCQNVDRQALLTIRGIGEETADRILLYACSRLAWPVDTYCIRVLAHYGIIQALPATLSERRTTASAIKSMIEAEMPKELDDWQRLHALFQLEGENLRPGKATPGRSGGIHG